MKYRIETDALGRISRVSRIEQIDLGIGELIESDLSEEQLIRFYSLLDGKLTLTGEDLFRFYRVVDGAYVKDPEQIARQKIIDIESSITPRRVREAVLGIDGGWLAARDAEIAALRSSQ